MTDAEKLAAIDAALQDLAALRRHLLTNGRTERLQPSGADCLRRIAKIVGFSFEAATHPAAPYPDLPAAAGSSRERGSTGTSSVRPARKKRVSAK